ncbi:nuclear transport factor 2 family protein [Nakamurella sp. YIM 132087]|uniref:Nuclear transport factor 2 family protein n=1 Tax=Nakamurella alba TaxID=2665158 RepID=A0A7K1FV71_9ACTN|nr:nuclear transport factor 2 family protein [Nakamurella alba]MTD17259.1 nuclear transport factor 2 family protein [Nakamurella alba]
MAVPEYMAHLDAGRFEEALALMAPDVTFLLALPGRQVTGSSREDYRDYVSSRSAPADRVHRILRHLHEGDTEVVYGVVEEGGHRATGAFMSIGRLTADGTIAGYQSYFDPSFSLFDAAEPALPGGSV